jgi:hypothetical protein
MLDESKGMDMERKNLADPGIELLAEKLYESKHKQVLVHHFSFAIVLQHHGFCFCCTICSATSIWFWHQV